MNKLPSGWNNDPVYFAALLATLAYEHPRWTDADLMARFGWSAERLKALRASKAVLKYPVQLLVEQALPPEALARLQARFPVQRRPTYWGALLGD